MSDQVSTARVNLPLPTGYLLKSVTVALILAGIDRRVICTYDCQGGPKIST